MIVVNASQLEALQRAGRVVAEVLNAMQAHAQPNMSTAELDHFGAQLLAKAGAESAPRVSYDFPGDTCISVNSEAAHGIPGERILQAGDLINIDVSAVLDGYFADTGASFILRPDATRDAIKQRLCTAAQRARDAGVAAAQAGAHMIDISHMRICN